MIRVVLDTNILISALLQPQGLPARTFVIVLAGTTAQLCVSGDVYAEYEEVIRRPKADDWVFASKQNRGRKPYWGQAILRRYLRPAARAVGIEKRIGWHTFRHSYSSLLRSVGTDLKVMQELLRHSSFRSTLDVYTQAITPAKHAAQAAVLSLVFSSTRSDASISDVAESRA
jgi:site-specific recombinase XerD